VSLHPDASTVGLVVGVRRRLEARQWDVAPVERRHEAPDIWQHVGWHGARGADKNSTQRVWTHGVGQRQPFCDSRAPPSGPSQGPTKIQHRECVDARRWTAI